jgi:gamma-aminobutyric acid type B receptor
LHFQGASGHISFNNKTGYTSASVDLHQVVDNTSVLAGYYDEDKQEIVSVGDAQFVENSFESMELVVHPALASLFLLLTILALALIVGTHVGTLVFSSFPAIRASSYRLGQLAFIGCYLIVLCFLCFTIREVTTSTSVSITSLCVIQAWCLPLGLTLILGTLTAKTWRLYRIFVHLKKPGKVPGDKVLVTAVLLLACFDIVFCSIWSARFPFATLCHETVTDDNTIEVRVECYSEYYYAWFGALTLYQGLIMASALVLALLTKNIRHKSFKTKSVTFLVYFLTITLSLGFPLYLILNASRVSGVNVEYVVLSLTYLAVVCLCFVFLFFPPVFSLLRVKVFHKMPGVNNCQKNINKKSFQPSSFTGKTLALYA